jgi:hypothetical protein
MKKKIKETTEKLSNGTITKDEADKILFGVMNSFLEDKIKQLNNEYESYDDYAQLNWGKIMGVEECLTSFKKNCL